ncbi:formylglycine-generating enzyme [Trichoplusia ni]|uniref:Formylglycine-generating enzyme n=1 Tax=Trichoplusia ni TaxID=7111 RepID=A0A7E5WJ63_TRINI|nr:formylglycine-generating enzyme [Trichoplusia ni]
MLNLIIICLLQPVLTSIPDSGSSGCGCNLNRDGSDKLVKDSIFSSSLNNKDQCEGNFEDSFNEAEKMSLIPSDEYQLGTDDIAIESDQEGPKRIVHLKSFYIDKYEVSNKDFSIFVNTTLYKTEAEQFGDSFVFSAFLNSTFRDQLVDFRAVQAVWWYKVSGANWLHPFGPDSDISEIMNHPVTHVSWKDAQAYCKWRNARLPTEAEWEAACRGGHKDTKYPWGDKLFPGRKHMANIWQGTFPTHNSAKDGYIGTNPVNMFPQNDFGLYNMAGNVWEWTEDSWAGKNPTEKVKKGGSYLCHLSYCYRYRCSSRSHNTEDSSAGNLGFRCAKSVQ